MKKTFFFLFFLTAIFLAPFMVAQKIELKQSSLTQKGFKAAPFALINRPFALIVYGFNNGAGVAKTLDSIFAQNYDNYRLIYIDDHSDDGSLDLARDLLLERAHTLIQNEERIGELASLSKAIFSCEDDEVVVVVDGQDWLAHEWVLQRLNSYYSNSDLWVTLGQYRDFPSYELGDLFALEGTPREQRFSPLHLKTFYASLFKQIRQADFISSAGYLPFCAEQAFMIPILEMAQEHVHLIEETLLIRNNLLVRLEPSEGKELCESFIRALAPYNPLTTLEVSSCGE